MEILLLFFSAIRPVGIIIVFIHHVPPRLPTYLPIYYVFIADERILTITGPGKM